MEELKSVEKKPKYKWLSKKVQNYSNAIIFSVAAILWAQTWDAIADNLLSDSTIAISKPLKETPESIKYKTDFLNTLTEMIIESSYNQIESDKWTIKAIEQRLKDKCNGLEKKCDIKKEMDFYKISEKEIVSYFKENITPWINVLTIKLNRKNTWKMLDLFPYIESIFIARYWEKYMDILNKESIEKEEYNLEINIFFQNWKYKITSMKLLKNHPKTKD